MESKHYNSDLAQIDSTNETDQYFESTNPFQNKNIAANRHQSLNDLDQSSKTGKRPRIQKPLYSVRLF